MRVIPLFLLLLGFSAGCAALFPGLAYEETSLGSTGPQGGYPVAYKYMGLDVEATIDEDGMIRIFGYTEDGQQGDIISLYPRNISQVEVRFPPDGSVITELSTDRARGCLMAKIDMERARRIKRAANVVVLLH